MEVARLRLQRRKVAIRVIVAAFSHKARHYAHLVRKVMSESPQVHRASRGRLNLVDSTQ